MSNRQTILSWLTYRICNAELKADLFVRCFHLVRIKRFIQGQDCIIDTANDLVNMLNSGKAMVSFQSELEDKEFCRLAKKLKMQTKRLNKGVKK